MLRELVSYDSIYDVSGEPLLFVVVLASLWNASAVFANGIVIDINGTESNATVALSVVGSSIFAPTQRAD